MTWELRLPISGSPNFKLTYRAEETPLGELSTSAATLPYDTTTAYHDCFSGHHLATLLVPQVQGIQVKKYWSSVVGQRNLGLSLANLNC